MENMQSVFGNLPRDTYSFYTDNRYKTINIDSFDIVYGIIKFPKNVVLYRGYDKQYKIFEDRPIFLTSNKSYAESYAKQPNHELGIFVIKQELRLFDLRFIKNIMQDLFEQEKTNSEVVRDVCYTLALSYGLCSFKRQIQLLKQRFENRIDPARKRSLEKYLNNPNGKDPVEIKGVRIGETYNDAESAILLKEAFQNVVHGYIAPRFDTPYHCDNDDIHPAEILLFNPSKINITQLMKDPNEKIKYDISNLFSSSAIHFPLRGFKNPKIYMLGGQTDPAKGYEIIYRKNEYFDKMSQKEYKKLSNKMKQSIKKLTGNTMWTFGEVPHPTTPISPWTDDFAPNEK